MICLNSLFRISGRISDFLLISSIIQAILFGVACIVLFVLFTSTCLRTKGLYLAFVETEEICGANIHVESMCQLKNEKLLKTYMMKRKMHYLCNLISLI